MFTVIKGLLKLGRAEGIKGQSIAEYMVLFGIIAGLTLLSLCSFYPTLQAACRDAYQAAAAVMR